MDQSTLKKGFRFCLVGGFVFCVDLGMLWLLSRFATPTVAVTGAYVVAVTVHFSLNKWWVFKSRDSEYGRQLLRYALTVFACWACTVCVFTLSLRSLTANIFLAKLMAIPPTTLLGFVLMRTFVFRRNQT